MLDDYLKHHPAKGKHRAGVGSLDFKAQSAVVSPTREIKIKQQEKNDGMVYLKRKGERPMKEEGGTSKQEMKKRSLTGYCQS